MSLVRIAIVMLAVVTGSQLFALDDQIMLQSILIKENSCGRFGKLGERGCWQMMPDNVEKYGGYQYVHAYAMLQDVKADLKKHGVWVSAYNIALYWNAGPKSMRGKAPSMSYRYALEVQQIYNQMNSPSSQPVR